MRNFFVLLFLSIIPLNLFCQQDRIFALHNIAGVKIDIDTIIKEDLQLEPFTSVKPISGLAFSGDITLQSDSSLVRIILMDDKFNEYLVYEIYPILAGVNQLSVEETGEETSLLNNITPSLVKIELIDASIYLKEFIISQEDTYQENTKGAVLFQQTKNKIERINQHIYDLEQSWVAGETSISKLSYQEKKSMFGGSVPNFQGFDYYVGGVFALPGAFAEDSEPSEIQSENYVQEESQFPDEFSWQDRHGTDWNTSVKDQTGCGSCYAFGNTAATELLVNLYFNRHLDYDLSEQNIVSCTDGSCDRGSPGEALDLIKNTGIVFEDCFPYAKSDGDCSDICSDVSERIKISNWNCLVFEEDIKNAIIAGATAATVYTWEHYMQIAGYKVLEAGDSLFLDGYEKENYISIKQNSPLIGRTAWLCKNSWGESWGNNGYGYLVAGKLGIRLQSLEGPVHSLMLNDGDIRCTDNDGDGYYYWGIGPKPAHCPDSPDKPDGDDSEPCIGPLDEFGKYTASTPIPEAEDTIILYGYSTDLYAEGSSIRWYDDKELQNLVHTGEQLTTKHAKPGKYTYYATQTIAGCESEANDVSLLIVNEVPPPQGHDTVINRKAKAILKVEGELRAEFKWYEDPFLTNLLYKGESFETVKTVPGNYTYYVTQTLCSIESAPDTVVLTISNNITVPDTAFLLALFDLNVDRDGNNRISNEEAEAIVSLDVSRNGINQMNGIEAFVNLDTLICSVNELTSLDVSGCSHLEYLNCSQNELTTLDFSNNLGLTVLNCGFNRLTSLKISNCTALRELKCSGNKLASLDVSNNSVLLSLSCGYNQMKNLDVSNCVELEELSTWRNQLTYLDVRNNNALLELLCWENQITSLDVSMNTALTELDFSYNQLTSLDVSNNTALMRVICNYNQLASLDVSNHNALSWLICNYNQLTNLDVTACNALKKIEIAGNQLNTLDVSACKVLDELICTNNQITSLDVSNNTSLTQLYCGINQLTKLDFSNNTNLTNLYCNRNQLTTLNVSNNTALTYFLCSSNQLSTLDITNNTNLSTLRIEEMPSLEEVCVWTKQFPPECLNLHKNGSPNVSFRTDCNPTNLIGVEEPPQSEISIYPNPTNYIITIEAAQPRPRAIEIRPLNGKLIAIENMAGTIHQLDLSSFQKGVYFITIRSKDFVTTRKIIKL